MTKKESIDKCLKEYGFSSLEEAISFVKSNGIDVDKEVKSIQPIAFDNAVEAYNLGVAIALKKGAKTAEEAAEYIGEGLQAFCKPGSVADERKIGLGHGKLASMLLNENTKCFCFLAGHESFAAAEGAMGIARTANKVRKEPLKVILNGLGKDAAYIIARINGFTFVNTSYDHETGELKILGEKSFSQGERGQVKVYGAYDVPEGVAIMIHEDVDVSITGNSTNPVRFQHPVAGTYKKWSYDHGKKYFSVASGGGTGRTLHPDNMGCGPASYGLTDTMGRMHCDAQFAGSSSVPAHVEMMGFIGMGNNPIVGATVALAVACVAK
ncbi:MAG TPA: GGGtGRT protein [Candidatus Caccopulliclostridium gallistercoris]|uniref:GGGtGRT protein n=1 Tax=Candidatus Caccopulliclostridium gallistercoris TaxID=2840719 RepID=A0A9D1NFL4_9FIRM|nr:GGGtGRT protein [Candidatus Caccopulliclostridium gallistercoris]